MWGTGCVSGLCWLFAEGPSQPLCPLLLPQAPLLPRTRGPWPLPTDEASAPRTPPAASKCGGCWLPSQGSCGRGGGGGGVVETGAFPFPGLDSPLCCPLGCPAARSLAPAHIPVVTLRVSGLELVSVRGIEFSQD